MKVEFDTTSGLRVLHLDSEEPVERQDTSGIYLSVTSHYRDTNGTVSARNVFIPVTREHLVTLQGVVTGVLDTVHENGDKKIKKNRR